MDPQGGDDLLNRLTLFLHTRTRSKPDYDNLNILVNDQFEPDFVVTFGTFGKRVARHTRGDRVLTSYTLCIFSSAGIRVRGRRRQQQPRPATR